MTETVVLVHGLFLRGPVMLPLALQLKTHGYTTALFSYPSRRLSPAENAIALRRFVTHLEAPVVHFVAHSLGGLVVRHLFAAGPPTRSGRVVTLGTPHRYSHAAHLIARFSFGRQFLHRSLEHGLLGDVPPWDGDVALGSIAGALPVGLGRIIPGLASPSDGTVAVQETRIDGMADHIVLPVSHTGLLLSPAAARQTAHFLRHGRFQHAHNP